MYEFVVSGSLRSFCWLCSKLELAQKSQQKPNVRNNICLRLPSLNYRRDSTNLELKTMYTSNRERVSNCNTSRTWSHVCLRPHNSDETMSNSIESQLHVAFL